MGNFFTNCRVFLSTKYNLILYFFITIVAFGSIGVWLPFVLDWMKADPKAKSIVSDSTWNGTPNNIITYYLSVLLVSLIDRILFIIDQNDYAYRKTEIFVSALVMLLVGYCVLKAYKLVSMFDIDSANTWAVIGACVSYVIWWIANYKETKTDPYNAWGKNPTETP